MTANAGELFETMKTRLKMQEEGITDPANSVKAATRELVEKLSVIDPSESIEIEISGNTKAKYIRASTGEILAKINEE
tara:strand:- start:147 stop:380 length:234 start_codon:yes stop_codon:yes gene_type:complete